MLGCEALLLFFACGLGVVAARPTCFVMSPNLLHVGVEESVVIVVHDVSRTTQVTLELKSADKKRTFSRRPGIQCPPGKPTTVDIKVTLADLGKEAEWVENPYVWLVVTSTSPSIAPPFTQETQVMVTRRVGHVFLQLDKTIYNPRQKMESRAYTVDQDLMPLDRTVRLEIKDPDGDMLVSEKKNSEIPGMINFTPFKFRQFSTPGIWTAAAYYGDKFQYKDEVKFEVREYDLPTFEVQVSHNEIITPDTTQITVNVAAKYTYGKDVKGRVTVTYGLLNPNTNIVVNFFSTSRHLTGDNNLFSLDTNKIKKETNRWFPEVKDKGFKLMVKARMREKATGKEEEDDTVVPFEASVYRISFDKTVKFFKPDLPFLVIVDVKSLVPLPEEERKIPIRITTSVVTSGGDRTYIGLRNDGQESTLTSDDGQARFTIDNVPASTTQLEITVSTDFEQGDQTNTEAMFVVEKQQSDSDDGYIAIRVAKEVFKVEDELEADIFGKFEEGTQLNYLVLAHGKIVQNGTSTVHGGILHILSFTVTAAMSPQAHMVVYYYRQTIVAADAILINVEKTCQSEVTLEIKQKPPYSPGDKIELNIEAAAESNVALMAVDQAVYLLREAGVLKRNKMFDFLYERDLACTVGGGQNSASVFKDSGLAVLTNAGLSTPRRDNELCQSSGHTRHKRSIITWDLPKCCQMGKDADNCRAGGMNLVMEGASVECTNNFYNCCTEANPEQKDSMAGMVILGSRGRTGQDSTSEQNIFEAIEVTKKIQLRRDFAESWLWEDATTNREGKAMKVLSLAGSITTWVFQGVAMSQTQGMCIAQALDVTAFQPVFIQLDLPSSSVVGEQIEVKATLFNYTPTRKSVRMFLEGTAGLCAGPKPDKRGGERQFHIDGTDTVAVSWPVIPLKIGQLPIKVYAYVADTEGMVVATDGVEKMLQVIADGKEQKEETSIKLDPAGESFGHMDKAQTVSKRIRNIPDSAEKTQLLIIDTKKRANFVPGSGKLTLTFYGDFMGPIVKDVLTGLEGTIKLPTGCGEQTMSKLGPTVYTARYLIKTKQMTHELETNAYEFIGQGIQRMNSKHSYAFFPGEKASVWLTAFVVKVFSQVKDFTSLDTSILKTICSSASRITENQRDDGSFDGGKYETFVRRDYRDPRTYTAFILIALLESDCQAQEIRGAVNAAVAYLNLNIRHINSSYSLAMTTYALAMANSPMKQEANSRLQRMSTYDSGLNTRYWSSQNAEPLTKRFWTTMRGRGSGTANRTCEFCGMQYRKSKAVETAAYALLAQLQLNNLPYSHAIVNWLITNKRSGGGFYSTQDTVIGLQALTEYRIRSGKRDLGMEITITSDNDKGRNQTLFLKKQDVLLHKKIELNRYIDDELKVVVTGQGSAYMDFRMQYNTKVGPNERSGEQQHCQFEININIHDCRSPETVPDDQADQNEDDKCSSVEVVVKYLGVEEAGMVMLDVGLFTGFKPKKEDLEKIKTTTGNNIAMYELSDRVVHFYVNQMVQNETVSVSFDIEQTSEVGNVQPVPVTVYRYYEPEESCTKFYHPEGYNHLLSYDCKDGICTCLAGECGKCYGVGRYDVAPKSYAVMKNLACAAEAVDYVITATVANVNDTAHPDLEIITALVETVAKNGSIAQMKAGNAITLVKRNTCGCPSLVEGNTYLIMGMDGIPEMMPNKEIRYFNYMDSETYVTQYLGNLDPKERDSTGKLISRGLTDRTRRAQKRFLKILKRKGCDT